MDKEFKIFKHPDTSVHNQQLAEKVYWIQRQRQAGFWLVAGIFVAMLVCVVLLFFMLPGSSGSGMPDSAQPLASQRVQQTNPVIVREIQLLKGQMGTLITDSIEAKVENLEKNLEDGIISKADLAAIQELKADLRVLKTYSLQTSFDSMRLLPSVLPQPSRNLFESERFAQDITSMKNLFYISMASWGLMLVVMGGVWLHGCYRIRQLESSRWVARELLDKPQSELY